MEPPISSRTGAQPPRIVEAEQPLPRAYEEAAALADEEGLIAIIAPSSLRTGREEPASLFDESRIPLLTPREAKGLEFDHVVVVEPTQIVEEGGERGLRELYVALTRPTKTLVLTHSLALPAELGQGSEEAQAAEVSRDV
jgi:superfamily I DNA/RNA helicase